MRAFCAARQTAWGVAGIAMSSWPSASVIALMTAGGAAIAPASPQPLIPSGFEGQGVTVMPIWNDGRSMARGMQWSVICAEDADRFVEDAAAGDTLLGPEVARMFFAACPGWPHGTRPDGFTAPLRSELPVLLLSGEFDPVTPPRYAERVLEGLPNGRHLVLRGQGHGTLGLGCMPRLLGQFMETADAKALDAGCLDTMTYVPPFTSFNGWEP